MEELACSQDFPHYNSMRAICCHGRAGGQVEILTVSTVNNYGDVGRVEILKIF